MFLTAPIRFKDNLYHHSRWLKQRYKPVKWDPATNAIKRKNLTNWATAVNLTIQPTLPIIAMCALSRCQTCATSTMTLTGAVVRVINIGMTSYVKTKKYLFRRFNWKQLGITVQGTLLFWWWLMQQFRHEGEWSRTTVLRTDTNTNQLIIASKLKVIIVFVFITNVQIR